MHEPDDPALVQTLRNSHFFKILEVVHENEYHEIKLLLIKDFGE